MLKISKIMVIALLGLAIGTVVTVDAARKSNRTKKVIISEDACALRRALCKLWTDHVFWTRLYIIAALNNLADLQATTNRLLQNQLDIGNALTPYYGNKAAQQLAQLLKDHILIAADVVKAAQAGNKKQLEESNARWHKNADDIAHFLSTANPDNWKYEEMQKMLYEHLKLTTDEVVAELSKNYDASVKTFDNILTQALAMADMFFKGIKAQFADRF